MDKIDVSVNGIERAMRDAVCATCGKATGEMSDQELQEFLLCMMSSAVSAVGISIANAMLEAEDMRDGSGKLVSAASISKVTRELLMASALKLIMDSEFKKRGISLGDKLAKLYGKVQ